MSSSFLSAWLPTSCLLGASHSLGDTRCVPSQTLGGGVTPLPQAMPRVEPVVWRAQPSSVTVHSTERWPGCWASSWLPGEACRHWSGGRCCGTPRGLSEPPLPARGLNHEPATPLSFPSYKAGRGPRLNSSLPCSPGLQMSCPTGSAHSWLLLGPSRASGLPLPQMLDQGQVVEMSLPYLGWGAPSPAHAHTPRVPGPPRALLQADGAPLPPMPAGR